MWINDLISREDLKKHKVYSEERHEYVVPVYNIDNALTVDLLVARARGETTRSTGKWIEGENGNIKCNKCGCEIRYSYLVGNKSDFPKFCCDCGAKMDKEADDEK